MSRPRMKIQYLPSPVEPSIASVDYSSYRGLPGVPTPPDNQHSLSPDTDMRVLAAELQRMASQNQSTTMGSAFAQQGGLSLAQMGSAAQGMSYVPYSMTLIQSPDLVSGLASPGMVHQGGGGYGSSTAGSGQGQGQGLSVTPGAGGAGGYGQVASHHFPSYPVVGAATATSRTLPDAEAAAVFVNLGPPSPGLDAMGGSPSQYNLAGLFERFRNMGPPPVPSSTQHRQGQRRTPSARTPSGTPGPQEPAAGPNQAAAMYRHGAPPQAEIPHISVQDYWLTGAVASQGLEHQHQLHGQQQQHQQAQQQQQQQQQHHQVLYSTTGYAPHLGQHSMGDANANISTTQAGNEHGYGSYDYSA